MLKIKYSVLIALLTMPFAGASLLAQEFLNQLPIDLTVRVFAGYDSNVPLSTDATSGPDGDSINGGVQLSAGHTLFQDGDTLVRVHLSGAALLQFDESDFNVFYISPGLSLRQVFDTGRIPTTLRAGLSGSQVWVGGDSFNQVLSANASLGFSVTPALTIGPSVALSLNEFEDDGANRSVTSRDSVRFRPGLFASLFIPEIGGQLSGSVYGILNDADGRDHDYRTLGFSAGYAQPFRTEMGVLTAKLGAGYARRKHQNFTTAPKRRQNIWSASGGLSLRINGHLTVDTALSWSDSNANRRDFSYDRFRASAGLTWRF